MFPLGSIFDARLKRAPPLVGWRVIETALGDPHERQGYARPGRIGRARLVDIRFSASGLFPPYLNQSTENRLSVIRVFFRQFAFRRREIANDFRCGKIAAGQRKTDSSESSVRFVGITPQPSRLRNAVSLCAACGSARRGLARQSKARHGAVMARSRWEHPLPAAFSCEHSVHRRSR